MVQRSWGGGVGSHTISLTTSVVDEKDALLDCRRARTGHLSTTSAVDTPTDGACSAAMGGSCATLLSTSPTTSIVAPTRPLNVTIASHTSSALGSLSSCNPPPSDVGPATEGSPVVQPICPIAVDCSKVGTTRFSLVYTGLVGGATSSPARLSSLAANGYSSSINSALQ